MSDRERIVLVCSRCGARNYKTTKRRGGKHGQRFEIKKHCPSCNAHTVHQETK